MSKILYEPYSERNDNGVWVLTYGQPVKTPFYFDWEGITAEGSSVKINIDQSCYAVIKIKADMRDRESIIEHSVNMGANNCVLVELGEVDMTTMKPDRLYHMGIVLYGDDDKIIRVLLRDLPIKVERSSLAL